VTRSASTRDLAVATAQICRSLLAIKRIAIGEGTSGMSGWSLRGTMCKLDMCPRRDKATRIERNAQANNVLVLIAAISTCIVLGSGEIAHTRPVRTADFLVESRAFCSCWRSWSSLDSDASSDACALRRRANTISSSSSR
jgi:hypothetical protein